MADEGITIRFHHKGRFTGNPLSYEGGEMFELDHVDPDRVSYFSIKSWVRGFLNYPDDGYTLWWKKSEECWDLDMREIALDKDAMDLVMYATATDSGGVIDIYLDHTEPVLPTDPVVPEPVLSEDVVVIEPVLHTDPVLPEPMLTEDPVVPEPVLPTVRSHGRKVLDKGKGKQLAAPRQGRGISTPAAPSQAAPAAATSQGRGRSTLVAPSHAAHAAATTQGRGRSTPAAPPPIAPQAFVRTTSAAQSKKTDPPPKKPPPKAKKTAAIASEQRGKKRGADNEIGHWIPGDHGTRYRNEPAGRGEKAKTPVGREGQGKKKLIKRRWI